MSTGEGDRGASVGKGYKESGTGSDKVADDGYAAVNGSMTTGIEVFVAACVVVVGGNRTLSHLSPSRI